MMLSPSSHVARAREHMDVINGSSKKQLVSTTRSSLANIAISR